MSEPIDATAFLDTLLSSPEGQELVRQRWKHAQDTAVARAADDRKARQEARKHGPSPLTGWDCWVCGWSGTRPGSRFSSDHCPDCHCLHGLRCADQPIANRVAVPFGVGG